MFNPELANLFVRITQCKTTTLRVRERSRVEVQFQIVLLSPFHPSLEVFSFNLVTVNELTTEFTISFVKVQTIRTSQKRRNLLDVLTKFIYIAGFARIVTSCLDTAGSSNVTFEADNIVSLPAMEADRSLL
jgi:hypothetical protein